MDRNIKLLYKYLAGWSKSPKEVIKEWSRIKAVAVAYDRDLIKESYPEYVRMCLRYEIK